MESTNVLTLLNEVRRDACAKFDPSESTKPLFEAIVTMVHISNVARKEGLLALEEMTYSDENAKVEDVASKIILIVDGCFPDVVVETVTNEYWINKYEGNEALRQYILMRGILMVQEGVNPYMIQKTLVSLIPKHLKKSCKEYIDAKEAEMKAINDAKIAEQYKTWSPVTLKSDEAKKTVTDTEVIILSLDDRALQRVMRDIDNSDLTVAMAGFAEDARNKLLKNMSKRLALMVVEDLLRVAPWSGESKIIEAAKKIQGIVKRLEDMGEIVVLP